MAKKRQLRRKGGKELEGCDEMSEQELKAALDRLVKVIRAGHEDDARERANLAAQIAVLRECTAAMATTIDALWRDRFGCPAPAPTSPPSESGKAN